MTHLRRASRNEAFGAPHVTTQDWLTGEAPFDGRSEADAFFLGRAAAHGRLARACGAAVRNLLDEAHASDAFADEEPAAADNGRRRSRRASAAGV